MNVKGIKDLHGITGAKNSVRIGAAVTLDEIAENPLIAKSLPSLHEAALGVSSPQIRNMGTIAGDLCQRPRCWYFRQGFGLFGKGPDGKSLVPNGENRYHAILGNGGPAYFVSASSFGPALVALGATIRLVSSTGSRDVEAEKFFVTPTADGAREIAMLPNEIITEIHVPIGTRQRDLRSPREGGARLAAGRGFGFAQDERQHHPVGARGVGARSSHAVGRRSCGTVARGQNV